MGAVRLGIKEAWESCSDRCGISIEGFIQDTADFEVTPLFFGGKCCGAMLVKGKEVHACVNPPWYARQAIRVINEVIDRHGEATTHTSTEAGQRIIEKLGFKKDGDIYRRTEKWESKQF